MKITWNSHFTVYKWCFPGAQTHSLIYICLGLLWGYNSQFEYLPQRLCGAITASHCCLHIVNYTDTVNNLTDHTDIVITWQCFKCFCTWYFFFFFLVPVNTHHGKTWKEDFKCHASKTQQTVDYFDQIRWQSTIFDQTRWQSIYRELRTLGATSSQLARSQKILSGFPWLLLGQ